MLNAIYSYEINSYHQKRSHELVHVPTNSSTAQSCTFSNYLLSTLGWLVQCVPLPPCIPYPLLAPCYPRHVVMYLVDLDRRFTATVIRKEVAIVFSMRACFLPPRITNKQHIFICYVTACDWSKFGLSSLHNYEITL